MNLLPVLAMMLALLHPVHSYEFTQAERATHGTPVVCLTSTDMHGLWAYEGWTGSPHPTWDYKARVVVLDRFDCESLRHWRKRDPELGWTLIVSNLCVLEHEYRHSQQHGGEPPYAEGERGADDVDADRWAQTHIREFARAMGIRQRIPRAATSGFNRCDANRAR